MYELKKARVEHSGLFFIKRTKTAFRHEASHELTLARE
jgi:hypothetical protein